MRTGPLSINKEKDLENDKVTQVFRKILVKKNNDFII